MNDSLGYQVLFTSGLLLSAAVGWYSTMALWRTHRRIAPYLKGSDDLLSQLLVSICLIVSVAATWYGYLALRRLLDFEPIDWSPAISWIIAIVVFLIPPGCRIVMLRIATDRSLDI